MGPLTDTTFPLLFFFIAALYSMVGFGGGSSYIALLILLGVSYKIAPSIALICNIIVVTAGTYRFYKKKYLNISLLLPFIITSIPFAYIGGLLPINKIVFQGLLALCLFVSGIKMIFFQHQFRNLEKAKQTPPSVLSLVIGGLVGLISGIVGIGGGIFLAPILYSLKWDSPKKIAAISSGFILVNSLAGLAGQLQKQKMIPLIIHYWPLMLAVFIGGQIGSLLINYKVSQRKVEQMTAILILIVSVRLFINLLR